MYKRILPEISLFLLIVFTLTVIGPFTMVPSYAHQLCSGCPTDDSTDTYCYFCNTEHNHIEEALDALDSEIENAYAFISEVEGFEGEVESYETSTMEEVSIKDAIKGGLRGLALTTLGAIATGLSIKAIIASGGTATPAAIWTARAGVVAAVGGGVATFVNFKNALMA